MSASSKVDNRKPSSASKFQEAGYVMRIQPRERERERQLGGARGAGEEGRSLFLHPRERKKERERESGLRRGLSRGNSARHKSFHPNFNTRGDALTTDLLNPGGSVAPVICVLVTFVPSTTTVSTNLSAEFTTSIGEYPAIADDSGTKGLFFLRCAFFG